MLHSCSDLIKVKVQTSRTVRSATQLMPEKSSAELPYTVSKGFISQTFSEPKGSLQLGYNPKEFSMMQTLTLRITSHFSVVNSGGGGGHL